MDFILEGVYRAVALLLALDAETCSAIWATLKVSIGSTLVAMLLGVPAGFVLGYARFPGRRALRTLVDTLLSLPTVVIGLIVYAFISRRGPLGEFELLFTLTGMGAGLVILGLPLITALTAAAVENLDARLDPTLRTLCARGVFLVRAALSEARYAVFLAGVTAFGRIVSEVGIAMMVGGNIKWSTRTITTAIALETGKGRFAEGIALGLVLMAIALILNVAAALFRRRGRA